MNKADLLEIIANGENSGVEFKRDVERGEALAKELVAFSNLSGGVVILGVEDTGELVGLARVDDDSAEHKTYRKLEEWVMGTCRDKIRPEIIPYFEIVRNLDTGLDAAVIRVEAGWSIHSVWHNQGHKYLVRVGSLSREASPEELERLFQRRGNVRAELRPVSGTSVADLDIDRLQYYFTVVRGQNTPEKDDALAWETLLNNTELMVSENDQRALSVAALLLFGLQPQRFLPHAKIEAAAYPGTEKSYETTERMSIHGPMVAQFGADGELVGRGMVEQAVDFIIRNTGSTSSIAEGGRRIDHPDYPIKVIREAIVNAVVHRDYLLSGTDIELSIYSDRMEIVSPGRLPNGITPARMRHGTRAARNQLIKDVMRDYQYLEHMGMGVPQIIIKIMNDVVGTDPEFIEEDERFVVRLSQPNL